MLGMTQKEKYAGLVQAIGRGDLAGVTKALDRGASPNRLSDSENGGPLVDALKIDSEPNAVAIISVLLEKGADINKKDRDGETVLHYFMRYRTDRPAVLGKLLDAGSDLAAVYSGMTPLYSAVRSGAWSAAEAILASKPDQPRPAVKGEPLLMAAVAKGAPVALLDKLQAVPMDVNARTEAGSALHLAVAAGNKDIVSWLLARPGIDVNIVSEDGATPLLSAVRAGKEALVAALLQAGADPNRADKSGETPLLASVQLDRKDIAASLLAANAAPGQADNAGTLPLDAAAGKGAAALVGMLLAALDAGTAKLDLQPALMIAAEKGHGRVLELLVAAGADVNATDGEGHTPLMKAALSDQLEALNILVKAGARPEIEDARGMRAYDHAVSGGKGQSREFLRRFPRESAAVGANGRANRAADGDRYTRLNDYSLEVRESPNLAVVFNFWMGQVIYRDPSQPSPIVVQSFAEVPRQQAVNDAYEKLKALGGNPPEPAIASFQKRPQRLGKG